MATSSPPNNKPCTETRKFLFNPDPKISSTRKMSSESWHNSTLTTASPKSISGFGKSMRISMAPSMSTNSHSCINAASSTRPGSSPETFSTWLNSWCMILQEEGASLLKTLWSLFMSAIQISLKNTSRTSLRRGKRLKMGSKEKYFSKNTSNKCENVTWKNDSNSKNREKPSPRLNSTKNKKTDHFNSPD